MVIISGPKIYAEAGVIENAALVINDDKIHAIDTEKKFKADKIFEFPANYHLLPGFIDVHIHGANGSDVMDGTLDALENISKTLAREGTTSFLATTMTATPEKIDEVLENISNYKQVDGAKMLGVHLEGPFLSPQKIGAQSREKIVAPNIDHVKRWQQKSGNLIKLVTLAPELPNSDAVIHYLTSQQIVVAIGHSDATYAETLSAIEHGCTHVTHLFNAMRGIHQREPGTVTAALLSEKVTAELIVDGEHLHPAIVLLALKIKGTEKIILVTDAMRAKCLSDGIYDLGGQEVSVKNSIATLSNGTLAGSTLTMFAAIKNMLQFTDCSMTDIVKFTAENPAKMLNIFQRTGSIAKNKDADLVVLDDQLNVVLTISHGKIIFITS